MERAPSLVSRALPDATLAVTEIRGNPQAPFKSATIPTEHAWLVAVQLRDFPDHHYWEDGRQAPVRRLRAGDVVLHDLRRDPVALLDKTFHSIHFYLRRSALGRVANEAGAPDIETLDDEPGAGIDDPVIRHLGLAMRGVLARGDRPARLVANHVALALATHVAARYGGARVSRPSARGGLAPWQLRRATERLAAALDGSLPLAALARECRLSPGHFARAFRQSTGLAPHRWLMRRRIEVALDLLRAGRSTLAEIAVASGFADQSHFTRVFTRMVGTSPGRWRRNMASAPKFASPRRA